ncbi:MAG: type IV pili twitching motility protein PilT, partial [Halomonas sp.]|nr:type IV pili twitching motility protein PilT [Halomonas sp.]
MTPREWLDQLLDIMVEKQASDMLISTNAPPNMKLSGKLVPLGDKPLSIVQVRELVLVALPENLR